FELDQVPVIPRRLRHGLVGVLKRGLAERQIVPLQARHLAGLAPDAGRRIDQLGDPFLPLRALARRRARMPGDAWHDQRGPAYPIFSSFTRKPLNSGVNALGSMTAGDSMLAGLSAVFPSSSAIPRYPQ